MNTQGKRTSDGFTLVEIMIAMVLTAMMLASAFLVVSQGFQVIELARDNTRAAQILQSEMERLRSQNFTLLVSEYKGVDNHFTVSGRFEEYFGTRYDLRRTVRQHKSRSDVYEIVVEARWIVNGQPKRQALRTLYTKDGLHDYYYRTP